MPESTGIAAPSHTVRAESAVANLFPGYFALVMATGIVSIAAEQRGLRPLAIAMLWLNAVAYVVLWVLTLARLVRYPGRLFADLTGHQKGAAFLTVVAGTNVLGSQFASLTSETGVATALWIVGCVLWIMLIYTFLAGVTIGEPKPSLDRGIGGVWLLLVVSTESIAVLGTVVASNVDDGRGVLFASLTAFFVGLMLYIVLMGLIFYRWTFFSMAADQLTPPYWINMGALAITTLAGANLLGARASWDVLEELTPFLTGTTFLAWGFATWWIPLLVIVGVWRHVKQRVPLTYDPQYWALVFPLGMYSAATFKMIGATGVEFLNLVPTAFFWIAFASWGATFAAMLVHLARVRPAGGRAGAS